MVNVTKEQQIVWDIYRDLYKYSTPKADFDELVEKATINEYGQKDIGFMNYEIPESLFNEIVEKHTKGRRLTKIKQQMIRNTILFGCSPKFKKDE